MSEEDSDIDRGFEVLDHMPVGACVLRKDFAVIFWNRCLEEWTGISRSVILGKNICDHYPHLKDPKYSMRLQGIFGGGPPTIFSSQLHGNVIPSFLRDGQMRIEHVTVTPVRSSQGEGFSALLCVQDVSDLTRRIQDYRAMRDKALEEVRERERVEGELRKTQEELEQRIRERTFDLVSANEELQREVGERRQAEGALRQSEERYRALFEDSRDAIYVTSRDGTFIDVNEAALCLFGYGKEEMLGLNVRKLYLDPADRDRFQKEIEEKGSVRDYELRLRRKDGRELSCLLTSTVRRDLDGDILGYQGIFRDMTERRKIEEDLLRAKKLESVSVLAGGIAHDFNNLLTAILGNVSLARMYAEGQEEPYERLVEAEKATIMAKDLTRQLLTFSSGAPPLRKKATVLGEVIRKAAYSALAGSAVKCQFSIAGELWPAEVDEGQIRQAIHNLVVNASEAMKDGGTIQFRAENITIKPEDILPLSVGSYVKMSIKDEGKGIAEEHIGKIFDPYFSTEKERSGLGLATVYSVIKNHNGFITVESQPGAGTTFYVYLPALPEGVPAAEETAAPAGGKGRILVVDDEELVRLVAGKILNRLGYEVWYASDGGEAVDLYRDARDTGQGFDAVILDLSMPVGMGGKEAAMKLIEIDPKVKAIVSSGYANDPIITDFGDFGFVGAVAKPYTIKEIDDVLHAVLAERVNNSA